MLRIWGGIFLIGFGLLFYFKTSIDAGLDISESIGDVGDLVQLRQSASTDDAFQAIGILSRHDGITEDNISEWPGLIDQYRDDPEVSAETVAFLEQMVAASREALARAAEIDIWIILQQAALLILLVAAVMVLINKYVPPATAVAAICAIVMAVTLAFFWTGPLPLVFAALILVGAIMAFAGHRVEQRAAAKALADQQI